MTRPGRSSETSAPEPAPQSFGDVTAGLLLVLLSLLWGITWPLMKIALLQVPPFSMRTATSLLGAATLVALVWLQGRSFRIPTLRAAVHVVVAAMLNITSFSIMSAFAQISAATTRVTILTYTMPIWAVLLARPVLGERLTATHALALGLCILGLSILIYPLAGAGVPHGLLLAVGTGVSWAAGTVYLKWARIPADPMAVAAWQLIISLVVIGACLPIFEGPLDFSRADARGILCVLFVGIGGMGIAYGLWFEIVRRVPAMTASLGVLSVPAVGVISSVLILGDRPTLTDIIGFLLIFAASACVLVAPNAARPVRLNR